MSLPTRRAALVVAVAALLVTAGCLGVTAPSDTGASPSADTANCTYDTNRTTTAPGTWSPDASVEQYPPGVADNGTLVNATTLVDAHFAVTANTSMELRMESSRGDSVYTLTHGPGRMPFYSTAERGPEGKRVRSEFYNTTAHGLARYTFDNETLYRVYQNTRANVDAWTGYGTFGGIEGSVHGLFSNGNYTVNGTVERGDSTFVELTADGDSVGSGYWNGTALVTPDGVVYDVDVSAVENTGENAGERHEVSLSMNTDVEWCGAPPWADSIPHLSLSIVEDGHAVEIRNTGGAAVPANTSLNVTGGEDPHYGTEGRPFRGDVKGSVTTEELLDPGDAVYVTAGADGSASSFALHGEPTRGEYGFGNAGLTGWHSLGDGDSAGKLGNVSYRLATGIEPWPEAE